jgi:periplasmic divalent cation tolerance protein
LPKEIIVLITAPSLREARAIGRKLVEERLAACANIIPQVASIFSWQGKICRERESLMILKTRQSCFDRLVTRVKSLHSYSVPEIIALPIILGSKDYLRWIRNSTR